MRVGAETFQLFIDPIDLRRDREAGSYGMPGRSDCSIVPELKAVQREEREIRGFDSFRFELRNCASCEGRRGVGAVR
jgi:hypothetical protein